MSPDLSQAYQAIQNPGASAAPPAAAAPDAGPTPPKLQTPPAPPNQNQEQFGKDSQEWLSAVTLLSGLAGALSRQHATTALNAFSAGMKGFQEGKGEAMDAAYKQWEEANKSILEQNKVLQDQYDNILKNNKLTIQEQMAQIRLIAAQEKDPLITQALESNRPDLVPPIISSRGAAADKLDKSSKTVGGYMEKFKAAQDMAYEKIKAAYPQLDNLAEAYHENGKLTDVVPGYGKSVQPLREAVQRRTKELYPDFNPAEAHLSYLGKTSGSSKLGRMEAGVKAASNILGASLPSLIDAAKKVNFGSSTDLNAAVAFAKEHSNDRDYKNFMAQLRAVAGDYAVLIGRGSQTVHSDEEALKILNGKMNVNSIKGFQDAVTAEEKNLKEGLARTRSEYGGSSPEGQDNENLPPVPASPPGPAAGWKIEPVGQ